MELIHELRQETEQAHRALEKDLVGKIKAVHSRADYENLLRMMYGFYAAMEKHMQPFLSDKPGLDFAHRRKADWLVRDIETVGSSAALSCCDVLPPINSASSALGAMYVLEGSTLGGQIIAKMLKQQLRVEGNSGLSFFLSYGTETTTMWERFKAELSKPFNALEQSEIIRTAKDTFIKFRTWIEQYDANKL